MYGQNGDNSLFTHFPIAWFRVNDFSWNLQNTVAFVYILLRIVFGGRLYLSVLQVNGERGFFELFAAMGRRKALTDKEREIIIK